MNAPHTPLLPHQTDRLNKRRKRRGTRKFKKWRLSKQMAALLDMACKGDPSSSWVLYGNGDIREIKFK